MEIIPRGGIFLIVCREGFGVVSLVRDGNSFFRSDRPVFCPVLGSAAPVALYTDGAEVHSD
jgi:hypothetical protein